MDRIILIIVLLGLVVLSTEGLWLGRQKKVRQENEHVQEKIAVGSRNARSAQDCLNDVNTQQVTSADVSSWQYLLTLCHIDINTTHLCIYLYLMHFVKFMYSRFYILSILNKI